jgi:hypothetical protein
MSQGKETAAKPKDRDAYLHTATAAGVCDTNALNQLLLSYHKDPWNMLYGFPSNNSSKPTRTRRASSRRPDRRAGASERPFSEPMYKQNKTQHSKTTHHNTKQNKTTKTTKKQNTAKQKQRNETNNTKQYIIRIMYVQPLSAAENAEAPEALHAGPEALHAEQDVEVPRSQWRSWSPERPRQGTGRQLDQQ